MGIVDKLNQLMNPDSVEDYDDGDYMFGDDGDAGYGTKYQQPGYAPQQQSGGTQGFQPNALELKVVKPEKFEDASPIADHLLSKRTIVLNLEDTTARWHAV